jgi:hypothetical protein
MAIQAVAYLAMLGGAVCARGATFSEFPTWDWDEWSVPFPDIYAPKHYLCWKDDRTCVKLESDDPMLGVRAVVHPRQVLRSLNSSNVCFIMDWNPSNCFARSSNAAAICFSNLVGFFAGASTHTTEQKNFWCPRNEALDKYQMWRTRIAGGKNRGGKGEFS